MNSALPELSALPRVGDCPGSKTTGQLPSVHSSSSVLLGIASSVCGLARDHRKLDVRWLVRTVMNLNRRHHRLRLVVILPACLQVPLKVRIASCNLDSDSMPRPKVV